MIRSHVQASLAFAFIFLVSLTVYAADSSETDAASAINEAVCLFIRLVWLITGAIAAIAIIFAGVRYLASGDDPGARNGAKTAIISVFVGIIIISIAVPVVNLAIPGYAGSFQCGMFTGIVKEADTSKEETGDQLLKISSVEECGVKGCGGFAGFGKEDCTPYESCFDGDCVFSPNDCCTDEYCGGADCTEDWEKCVIDEEGETCHCADPLTIGAGECGPVACADFTCTAGELCRFRARFGGMIESLRCEPADECMSDPKDYGMCVPEYNPGLWNDDMLRRLSNYCYDYACDIMSNAEAQPGYASGKIWSSSCSVIIEAAESDGLEYIGLVDKECTGCSHKVALVVDTVEPNTDFHWYRQDLDGYWSHKQGGTTATNLDYSGNLITNPETADRRTLRSDTTYETFCGYFCVDKSLVDIDGFCTAFEYDESTGTFLEYCLGT